MKSATSFALNRQVDVSNLNKPIDEDNIKVRDSRRTSFCKLASEGKQNRTSPLAEHTHVVNHAIRCRWQSSCGHVCSAPEDAVHAVSVELHA